MVHSAYIHDLQPRPIGHHRYNSDFVTLLHLMSLKYGNNLSMHSSIDNDENKMNCYLDHQDQYVYILKLSGNTEYCRI